MQIFVVSFLEICKYFFVLGVVGYAFEYVRKRTDLDVGKMFLPC